MDITDLDYELPPERVAQMPLPERQASRLLVMNTIAGELVHSAVADLPRLLVPALFVVNNTRVLPARLLGRKAQTGGKVELLLTERLSESGLQEDWRAMGKASQGFAPGMQLEFSTELKAEVVSVDDDGLLLVRLQSDKPVSAVLNAVGRLPLPSYIRREPNVVDDERYQTIFASEPGAVAAPTAGLHFGRELLQRLQECGHTVAEVTLHVGMGTFAPLRADRLEDHRMHEERFSVSEDTASKIRSAKAEGRPVVAIGTTVARTLESATNTYGDVQAGAGRTKLFIYPPYQFQSVDVLMTNFHLPRSTLLAMVMAFAGIDHIKAAYAQAIAANYRFFSYGDAMLLAPNAYLRS